MTMMRHELRKLEIENEKLRQTLKRKLEHKSSLCLNYKKNQALSELSEAKSKDEFYEMIKLGFTEQMTNSNSEMRQTQEYSQVITRWVSDTFNVKLLRTMQIAELKNILNGIDLSHGLNQSYQQRQNELLRQTLSGNKSRSPSI